MKPDEKLTKETGRPVVKGVMDHDDLDVGQPVDENVPEAELDRATDEAEKEWSKPLPKDIG